MVTAIHSRRSENTITRTNGKLIAIRALLDRDALSRAIVSYLARHTEAADTARGIAEWWVNGSVSATADALAKLEALGVVCAYAVHDSTAVYAYTKNPLLRQTLGHYVDDLWRTAEAPAR